MNSKLQWLRNTMNSLDLQGIIISNPVNIKIFDKHRRRRNFTSNKKR